MKVIRMFIDDWELPLDVEKFLNDELDYSHFLFAMVIILREDLVELTLVY
jgi:hypothetical protein